MSDRKIENAVIKSTSLLPSNDHGIFDAWLMVEGDGWGIGFGGFSLDAPVKFDGKFSHREDRDGTVGEYIRQICETVGVSRWEDLPGKHIRIETEGLGGGAVRIGHFMKDKWFNPREWFASRSVSE